MRRSTLKDKMPLIILGVLAVVGFTIGFAVPRLLPSGGSAGLWPDFFDAERLIKESDRIVVAKFMGETPHELPRVSRATGEQYGTKTEAYRRFEVIESLKDDDAKAGDRIIVVSTKGLTDSAGVFEPYDKFSVLEGQEYLLILRKAPSYPEYPPTPGGYDNALWIPVGEPGIAQIDYDNDGRLLFKASGRYKDEIVGLGMALRPGSDAPFELTKKGLRDIIANQSETASRP